MAGEKREFSAWKFDWVDALTTGVEGRELRVALYLLQRCNAETGRLNPSMENVAHMLACTVRTVERAVERLSALGVLTCTRESRHESYQYHFREDWKVEMLEVRKSLQSVWDGRRYERFSASPRPDNSVGSDGVNRLSEQRPDPTVLTGPDPTDVSG